MHNSREVVEGPVRQGVNEAIAYELDVSRVASGEPETDSVEVDVFLADDLSTSVKDTVMQGAPAVSGSVITLPVLGDLTAGKRYRVEVLYAIKANIFETYFYVNAEQ